MTAKGSDKMKVTNTLGHKVGNNCKRVWCTDNGKSWPSAVACAKEMGVPQHRIHEACNPNSSRKTCNGFHFSYEENVHEVQTKMARTLAERAEKQTELERKAALWDAYEAEQNAARKAKEAHEAAVAKAMEKVARRQRIYEATMEKAKACNIRLAEAKRELEALNGGVLSA